MTPEESRTRCAGCGSATTVANVGMPPRVEPARSDDAQVSLMGARVQMRVCPQCARIEFFAADVTPFE
jgi:hypothetical protein